MLTRSETFLELSLALCELRAEAGLEARAVSFGFATSRMDSIATAILHSPEALEALGAQLGGASYRWSLLGTRRDVTIGNDKLTLVVRPEDAEKRESDNDGRKK